MTGSATPARDSSLHGHSRPEAPTSGSPGRFASRLLIAGCSRRKAETDRPVPALQLYQGGCVPALRARIGGNLAARARTRFLSAEHGLVTADSLLPRYDRSLSLGRATELRPRVAAELDAEFAENGVPDEVLLIAEPLYLVLVADLLALPGRPAVIWLPDPGGDWPAAAAVLDRWRWA